MQNHIGDTSVPKVKRFGIGDQRHVQAQRIWLILVAHVMAEQQWRTDSRRRGPRQPGEEFITYGELAERMQMRGKRQAGRNLGPPLGVVGEYCRVNGLPTLNSIVLLRTGEPGSRVLVRDGKTYQEERREVMETDWFVYRVPTTGAFRKVIAYQRRMLELEIEGSDNERQN